MTGRLFGGLEQRLRFSDILPWLDYLINPIQAALGSKLHNGGGGGRSSIEVGGVHTVAQNRG